MEPLTASKLVTLLETDYLMVAKCARVLTSDGLIKEPYGHVIGPREYGKGGLGLIGKSYNVAAVLAKKRQKDWVSNKFAYAKFIWSTEFIRSSTFVWDSWFSDEDKATMSADILFGDFADDDTFTRYTLKDLLYRNSQGWHASAMQYMTVPRTKVVNELVIAESAETVDLAHRIFELYGQCDHSVIVDAFSNARRTLMNSNLINVLVDAINKAKATNV